MPVVAAAAACSSSSSSTANSTCAAHSSHCCASAAAGRASPCQYAAHFHQAGQQCLVSSRASAGSIPSRPCAGADTALPAVLAPMHLQHYAASQQQLLAGQLQQLILMQQHLQHADRSCCISPADPQEEAGSSLACSPLLKCQPCRRKCVGPRPAVADVTSGKHQQEQQDCYSVSPAATSGGDSKAAQVAAPGVTIPVFHWHPATVSYQ
jgi:hypothetical protein